MSLAQRLLPAVLASTVALGAAAGSAAAAGSQTIDATTRLTCGNTQYDGTFVPRPGDFELRLTATAPATTASGELVQLTDVSATVRLLDVPGEPPEPDNSGYVGYPYNVTLAVTGASPATIALNQPYSGIGGNKNEGGYTSSRLPRDGFFTPVAAVQTTGTAPVELRIGSFNLNWKYVIQGIPTTPDLGGNANCKPVAGSAPLATVANPAVPVSLPVVKSVSGSAVAQFGGLVLVRGTKLAGAKSVTIGTRRVSPLLSTASTVWVWAPPLAKGSYLVSVTTAAGTSAPVQTARVTYR